MTSGLSKRTIDGHVEPMILAVLSDGPSYGYQIGQDLLSRSNGVLKLGEGTLYPVLHRMESRGLIGATWRKGPNGRDRRYYRLTPKGRRAKADYADQWQQLVAVMKAVTHPQSGQA